MTNETQFTAVSADMGGYLQFQVPSLPYSAVRIPLVEDLEEQDEWVARAMNAAQLLAKAYAETFAEPFEDVPERAPVRPAGNASTAMRRPVAPQRQAAPPRRAAAAPALDPNLIVEGFCPDHPNVAALPSIPRYQEVEMGEDGYERYAKYFCPGKENGTGANHNLYARQLVAGVTA
jgi:hypothetical protein